MSTTPRLTRQGSGGTYPSALIVEDSPHWLRDLVGAFSKAGFSVTEAVSAD